MLRSQDQRHLETTFLVSVSVSQYCDKTVAHCN